MSRIQKFEITNCQQAFGATRTIIHCWWKTPWFSHLGRQAVLTNLTIVLQYNSAIILLGVYITDLKYPHIKLHTNIYHTFTHCNFYLQSPKASKVSFIKWMDKQTVMHAYIWILFRDKKEWTINPQNDMEESKIYAVGWKKL